VMFRTVMLSVVLISKESISTPGLSWGSRCAERACVPIFVITPQFGWMCCGFCSVRQDIRSHMVFKYS